MNKLCLWPYLLLMISQTGGGGPGVGGGDPVVGGGGGNLHPGGTIQNCAMCSHELSIVPLGSMQSSMVLLSQTPTEYQQNFKKLRKRSTSQTVYHDGEFSAAKKLGWKRNFINQFNNNQYIFRIHVELSDRGF